MASDHSVPRSDSQNDGSNVGGSSREKRVDDGARDLHDSNDITSLSPAPASLSAAAPEQSDHSLSGNKNRQPTETDDRAVIEDAQTVIRASSVGGRSKENADGRRQTPAAVAQVLVGQFLDHFRIDALIGGGGMGAVFRAHDQQLDRTVAIKVIPFVGDDPELQRRFRNESQSAAKLDHPQIAKVYGAGNREQWHYIVFEYVEGTNIRDWVNTHGVLSLDDAISFTAQLADALQHTADRGIVHRDVKPSNVLISSEGAIKLVDMGLARSENLDLSEDMTASGVTLGTFDYISPEQAQNPRDADLRSDIYSLGCTLYFMLTGNPPYPGGTMLQKLLSHENAPPPNARHLRHEVSSNLTAVIDKMLAKKPARRYVNAADLIADLREVAARDQLKLSLAAGSGALGATGAESRSSLLSRLEQHFPWAAALLLLLVIAGWLHLESAVSRAEITAPVSKTELIMLDPEPSNDLQGPDSWGPGRSSDSPFSDANASFGGNVALDSTTRPGMAGVSGLGTSNSNARDLRTEAPMMVPFPEGLSQSDRDTYEATSPLGPGSVSSGGRILDLGMVDSNPILRDVDRDVDIEEENAEGFVRINDDGDRLFDDAGLEFVPESVRVFGGASPLSLRKLGTGELRLTSLQQAIDIAKRYQLEQVELASVNLVSPPLRIDTNNMRVFSSVGGTVVEFDSSGANALQSSANSQLGSPQSGMPRPVMCSLGTSIVAFEGVHFVWDLPAEQTDGGSLFTMAPRSQTRLSQCTITVNNAADREEVYAFNYMSDPERSPGLGSLSGSSLSESSLSGNSFGSVSPEAGLTGAATTDLFPLVELDLSNVVVRGQMTMVHMDHAARLWLNWDNGLLAVSRYMIDTAGAKEPLPSGAGPMKLSFSRVTARASSGVGRVRLDAGGVHPFGIYRSARNSVFVVDSGKPQFEFINIPATVANNSFDAAISREAVLIGGAEASVLRLEGSSNAYVVQPTLVDPLLRLTLSDGQVATTPMSALTQDPREWMDENLPRWNVRWSSGGLPVGPFSDHRPADYRQDEMLTPGFEEKNLPMPPQVSRFRDFSEAGDSIVQP